MEVVGDLAVRNLFRRSLLAVAVFVVHIGRSFWRKIEGQGLSDQSTLVVKLGGTGGSIGEGAYW